MQIDLVAAQKRTKADSEAALEPLTVQDFLLTNFFIVIKHDIAEHLNSPLVLQ